jgi:hypothetical protein
MNLQKTAPHTFQLPPAVLEEPVPEFWGKNNPVSIQYRQIQLTMITAFLK